MSRGKHQEPRRRTTWARSTRLKRLVVLPLVLALTVGVAWAYWTAGSVPGGNGAAAATSVNQGATPTTSGTGPTITVSWAATTLASGQAVSGYQIKRYDANTLALQTILSACTGTISALTCTESGVPGGSWKYSVTPALATTWVGVESPKSITVTTDGTAPTNVLSRSVLSGGAYLTGTSLYYRGDAAGSFTLTNALTDAGSGPASSQTAALTGTTTGWTHTPSTVSTPAGGPYVSNTFSWTAGTTSGPGEVVIGSDVAGNTAATALTMVNDSTNPSGGSISYTNGYTSGTSVVVTYTSGTDAGSGVDSTLARIKRSVAPLTGGVCGTYLTNNNYALNPTSPYTDSNLSSGNCYTYQYVTTDNVGHTSFASSASVAMVDYNGAVSATSGLLSRWRFGEMPISSSDSFTDTTGTLLSAHTSSTGTTWTVQGGSNTTAQISASGTVRRGAAGTAAYYTSAVPLSADYLLEADVVVKSLLAGDFAGVIGRVDTTGTGSGTFYTARYNVDLGRWELYRFVNGGQTNLGTFAQVLTSGQSYRVGLDMHGSTISVLVNGAVVVTVTDTGITTAGRAGVRFFNNASAGSDTTALHLDNLEVSPPAADSKGSNTGDYHEGVLLGASGAVTGDANTAATFDGAGDKMQVAAPTGLPTGAAARSVETWFKTPGVASAQVRQALFAYGSNADGQWFGAWLEGGGTQIKAWGGNAFDRVFTFPNNFNDGLWHHFVETYDGTTVKMYVDSVAGTGGSASLTLNTIVNSYGFGVGAVLDPATGGLATASYFNGSLDEMSFYTTALSAGTVTDHYQLGSGFRPVVTATVANLAYTENATSLLDSGITVTDSDGTNLTGATVSMTTAYVNGQDTLAFTNQNGITGTWTAATGVMALSGMATVASYQAALRSITYNNNSDAPTTSTRTVTFVASDSGPSNTASRQITLTAVNDAPINAVPTGQNASMNTVKVFSSGNGNLISISDVDAALASVQVQLVSTGGATTLSTTTGLTFSAGDGTDDPTMTFTGTTTAVNTALAGLSFNPTTGFAGTASLQINTNDQGNTGTGGTLSDSDTVAITVTYAQMAYVANSGSNTVTPINVTTGTAGSSITVGTAPRGIAYTPDGTKAYVTNNTSGTVSVITVATGAVTATITVGTLPRGIAITPDGTKAYVTNQGSATVTPINLPANTKGTAIAVGNTPTGVAFTPDGTMAYVTNYGSNTVTPITVSSNTPGTAITVGAGPFGVAVNPAGTKAYVANNGTNTVSVITVGGGVSATITVGSAPLGVAFTPDGAKAYVANQTSNTVTPITVSTNTASTAISGVGTTPDGVAITPDGTKAYISSEGSAKVTPITVSDNSVGTQITVGTTPMGVAMVPDQAPTAALAVITGAAAGSPVSLDASASTSTTSAIATYMFDFGDGSATTTASPTTTHTYAYAAGYTVTLTVTDTVGTSTTRVFTGQTVSRNGSSVATTTRAVTITGGPGYFSTILGTTGLLNYFHLAEALSSSPAQDFKGTNDGTYVGGPTMAQPGAITGDNSVTFDGVNDTITVPRLIADDFSIEFWFKSSQGIGTGTRWYDGAGLIDADLVGTANDFGISLRSDGKIVAGTGNPDTSIVSSSGGYNNNAWHHVVFTRTRSSGALKLYVDGSAVGTATGNANFLDDQATISFGRISDPKNYYAGSLDEVAFYWTVLSAGTITSHFNAR